MPVWQETVLLLAGALVLAIVIKALFLQAFYIPSESMEPGLVKNDRILVEKPSYWLGGEPQRGDVVVFKDPGGWLGPEDVAEGSNAFTRVLTKVGLYPSGGHLVKRVIGVPGDVVECCDQQGRLLVNGEPIDESAYARPADRGCAPGSQGVCFGPMPGAKRWKTQTVPEGMLFVMGDNRAHSADSSYHLCTERETDCSDSPWVSADLVVGKVMAVVWPASKLRLEHRPDSFDGVPAR
jgi:signal peptidase I